VSRVDILASYLAAHWRSRALHGARLREWQQRRATQQVDYIRAHSPFHRELWSGLPSEAWHTFPTVDKRAMMAHFDRFTTVGMSRDRAMQVALAAEQQRNFGTTIDGHTVGLSSGTSGHRGLFLVSPREQTRWAGTILARAIPDLRPGLRVAFFLRANSRLYERTSSVVNFQFFDLLQPLPSVLASLQLFRPRVIVGPPTLLAQLADAVVAGKLTLHTSRLISVAEVIEPQDRARLETVFQVPVGEVYQCTEGLVAVSCRAGVLHVQEDVMVVQHDAIDPSDPLRVTPILTDLWRTTQPIVRYRLGDVLQLSGAPCACGSDWQAIAHVEGRQDDLCWFPQADDTLRPVFPDAIRRMILLADDRICEYRAEQPAAGVLEIAVDVSALTQVSEIVQRIEQHVATGLRDLACRATRVHVTLGVPPTAPGAKRRRVICSWRAATPAPASGVSIQT
jgi:putative adenylate-forming enzyme